MSTAAIPPYITRMKKNAFLKSAAVLSFGGILAKGIGALYRIPLAGILGGYGMGLYQMAYPLFCVLLALSSAGIPSAFSRIVAREAARGHDLAPTLKTALRLFAVLGLCGTAAMCLLAPFMSALQGDGGLLSCYLFLAPSVFLVALIAVFRGYFQGKEDMTPTALSEVAEQLVKAVFGLYFATRFAERPVLAVGLCLFSVTLSELCALLFLLTCRKKEPARMLAVRRTDGREIFLSVLPVMAATGLLPLSQTVDSVLLVRLLRGGTEHAVALYGLFAGGAASLISLPATLCCGLAKAAVPSVSRASAVGNGEEAGARAMYALLVTLLLSAPCALGLFFFARPIVSFLYGNLAREEAEILIVLVKTLSVSAVSLACVDTLAACLTGMGRAKTAALSMLIAVAAKFALQVALVPRLSVGGAAISANVCYLVAFFLDLYYTVKKKRINGYDHGHRFGNRERRRVGAGDLRHEEGAEGARAQYVARRGNTA